MNKYTSAKILMINNTATVNYTTQMLEIIVLVTSNKTINKDMEELYYEVELTLRESGTQVTWKEKLSFKIICINR